MTFVTKDGGDRATFAGGMVRDTEQGKIRLDLIPDGIFFDYYANEKNCEAIEAYNAYQKGEGYINLIKEIIAVECGGDEVAYWKRVAELMTRGAEKYGEHNWMLGKTKDVHQRFKKSFDRHFKQWIMGDREEDHAAACAFNLNGILYTARFKGEWGEVS